MIEGILRFLLIEIEHADFEQRFHLLRILVEHVVLQ